MDNFFIVLSSQCSFFVLRLITRPATIGDNTWLRIGIFVCFYARSMMEGYYMLFFFFHRVKFVIDPLGCHCCCKPKHPPVVLVTNNSKNIPLIRTAFSHNIRSSTELFNSSEVRKRLRSFLMKF